MVFDAQTEEWKATQKSEDGGGYRGNGECVEHDNCSIFFISLSILLIVYK